MLETYNSYNYETRTGEWGNPIKTQANNQHEALVLALCKLNGPDFDDSFGPHTLTQEEGRLVAIGNVGSGQGSGQIVLVTSRDKIKEADLEKYELLDEDEDDEDDE